jgi:hypothetical protein
MTPQEFAEWRHDAVHALIDLNEQCDREFHLDRWPRWRCELDSAKLIFSDEALPRVTASILVAGTSSTEKREWRWGWANQSLPQPAVDRMREVREFGETSGVAELTHETLPADEHLGWEMTALAARVLGAKGAYRCPNKEGFTYLIYTDIALAPQPDARRPEVQCSAHGRGLSTYVCEHLVANPAQSWFSDEPCAAEPWPDGWCAQCERIYQEAGEWNEQSAGRIQIKRVCHRCYESLRRRSTPE